MVFCTQLLYMCLLLAGANARKGLARRKKLVALCVKPVSSRVEDFFKLLNFSLTQTYYIYYGTVLSGASSMPVGSTTSRSFIVGHLQQGDVYVFEVSLGRFRPHSYPVNSKPKSGMCEEWYRVVANWVSKAMRSKNKSES